MSGKVLTTETEDAPKPVTVTLDEGAVAHLVIQFDPQKGMKVTGDAIDKMPRASLYFQLQLIQEKLMYQQLMEEQARAQREQATQVQAASGRMRSPWG